MNKILGDILNGHLTITGEFNQEQDGALDKTLLTSNVPKFYKGRTSADEGFEPGSYLLACNSQSKEYTFVRLF